MDYFVDPINGDNTNDGLTPATAIADILAIDTGDELATYWLRRGGVFTLPSDGTTITKKNGVFISYPEVDDRKFADRPQAAIDAGWDDDASAPFIFSLNKDGVSWSLLSTTFDEHLEFHGCTFDISANTATSVLFSVHAPFLKLYDTKIVHTSSVQFEVFNQVTTGGGTSPEEPIELINCTSSSEGSGNMYFLVADASGAISYVKRYKITDSNLSGFYVAFYILPNYHAYTYDIEIENSTIESYSHFARFRTTNSYSTSTFNCRIKGSTIKATTGHVFRFGDASYMRIYRGNLLFEDSRFFSPSRLLSFDQRSNSSSYYERIDSIIMRRCEIACSSTIYSYAYARVAIAQPVLLEDCKFIGQTYVLDMYGTQANTFSIIGAMFDRTKNILNTNASYYSSTELYISFKGQTLLGNIASLVSSLKINIEDSIIFGYVSTTSTAMLEGEIISSEVGAIGSAGKGSMQLLGSKIVASSGQVLQNFIGTIVDCQIVGQASVLFNDDLSSVMIEGSTFIIAGMGVPSLSTIRMLRSTVNNVPIPFSEIAKNRSMKSSPIYRVGGADYSLACSFTSFRSDDLYSVPNIYGKYVAGKNIMSIYLASPDSEIKDNITVRAMFIENGELQTIEIATPTPDASSWSGVAQSVTGFKYSVDLSGHQLLEAQSVRFIVSLMAQENDVTTLYLDPLVKGE